MGGRALCFSVLLAACGAKAAATGSTAPPSNQLHPELVAAADPAPEPAPAATWGAVLPDGTSVRILDVHPDDGYASQASSIVGLVCNVRESMEEMAAGYYAGQLICNDGNDYYFYKVRLQPADAPPPPAEITGTSYGQTLADGTTFTIVALSPEDAFYDDATRIVSLRCTASGPLTETGTGLYGGSARCSDGQDYTFYQVSITTP